MKLLSLKEVRDMWPDPKPSWRAIKRVCDKFSIGNKARGAGSILLTAREVDAFLDACQGKPPSPELAERMKQRETHHKLRRRAFEVGSCVYFVKAGNKVKIGQACNLSGRLSVMQTGCPDLLQIIGIVPGGVDTERQLHERFAEHRYRGEWFYLRKAIKDYIAEHSLR